MSEVKVDKISPRSGTAFTLGDSGDTFTIPSGATIVNSGTATGFASGLASVQTFTSSGTWTRPSEITKVIMEVQGAGGAGSAASSNYGGGAGGGYAKKFLDVSSISTSTITVGAGGAATSGGAGAGANGGLSSWADGTNTITGNGGLGNPASSTANVVGATGVGGDLNIQGGRGNYTWSGGGSMFSTDFGGANVTGLQKNGYGGGGGNGYSSYASGAGAPGIVLVWEYK
tara:strand:+ start:49 stop:735 length:687 start_codon:yes stop_codon:yes gene_type:complete